MTASVSPESARTLSAQDLGFSFPPPLSHPVPSTLTPHEEVQPLDADDPLLQQTKQLLARYGGVIFVGPPGTGKSYYASRIAASLAEGHPDRVRRLQLHPSYQYEQFMEGLTPDFEKPGQFKAVTGHFLAICQQAMRSDHTHVILIDELSRGEPGRVFGEALTYVEKSKRGIEFLLPSGRSMVVPANVVVLATMNPVDRGADEVDAAFDRRFAKIEMNPDPAELTRFLVEAGMEPKLRARVVEFFEFVQTQAKDNPYLNLGHTYFIGANTLDDLHRLWESQLKFNVRKAFPFDVEQATAIFDAWNSVIDVELTAN